MRDDRPIKVYRHLWQMSEATAIRSAGGDRIGHGDVRRRRGVGRCVSILSDAALTREAGIAPAATVTAQTSTAFTQAERRA